MRMLARIPILLLATAALGADKPTTQTSEPAVKDGLSVVVTMAKSAFGPKDDLAFEVTFKNVSDKPLVLYPGHALTQTNHLLLVKQAQAQGDWELNIAQGRMQDLRQFDRRQDSNPNLHLEPKQSATLKTANDPNVFYQFHWNGEQDEDRGDIRYLPPGKYLMKVKFTFAGPKNVDKIMPWWAGEITSEPVAFEISEKVAAPATTQAAGGSVRIVRMKDSVQITVTGGTFPVLNSMPVLHIGQQRSRISRYSPSGELTTLIFTMPAADFDKTKDGDTISVAYEPGGGFLGGAFGTLDKSKVEQQP